MKKSCWKQRRRVVPLINRPCSRLQFGSSPVGQHHHHAPSIHRPITHTSLGPPICSPPLPTPLLPQRHTRSHGEHSSLLAQVPRQYASQLNPLSPLDPTRLCLGCHAILGLRSIDRWSSTISSVIGRRSIGSKSLQKTETCPTSSSRFVHASSLSHSHPKLEISFSITQVAYKLLNLTYPLERHHIGHF